MGCNPGMWFKCFSHTLGPLNIWWPVCCTIWVSLVGFVLPEDVDPNGPVLRLLISHAIFDVLSLLPIYSLGCELLPVFLATSLSAIFISLSWKWSSGPVIQRRFAYRSVTMVMVFYKSNKKK